LISGDERNLVLGFITSLAFDWNARKKDKKRKKIKKKEN